MPPYILPGTEVGPRRARVLGACAVLLALVLVVGWRVQPERRPADEIRVALLTGHVGEGIEPGTDVRLDGVRVGSVISIDTAAPGRQRVELGLLRSQLFGLSDALTVDYAPGNLFGISAVQLHSRGGGQLLADGSTIDLTGRNADRVQDATLSALLRSTGQLTNDVLTPQLSDLLHKTSQDLTAFTPLLQALGTTIRSYTETQRLPPSLLFDRYGSVLTGLPPMLTGAITLLYGDLTNAYLANPDNLTRYGDLWTNVQNLLLPAATRTLGTARGYFGELLPIAPLILDRLSSSVSTPERSAGQLSELLDRLDTAFHDSPTGPVLHAGVELDSVPGLSAPLSATVGGGHP
ncbi:MlaD family protein [Nocardia wallacei]|uniref:MlaD family protein n=1 Tax=Nocardia wallacei TaxID=480035 RepID=UPI002454043B|nr:MlaD family protein [Nocardia wallacei]